MSTQKMKCLVSGGAGFVGSHVVDLLIKEGYEVVVVDDFSTGKEENLNKKATLEKGSITDATFLAKVFQGHDFDVVFHLAAWARVQRSVEDPSGTNNVNVTGTLNLLEMCRLCKVNKFIFSSSSSVYGKQTNAEMNEDIYRNPGHPYALQKCIGEDYCEMYSALYGMSCVALRYFNVYGPRQVTEGDYALVLGKFLRQKASGEKMTIYGSGRQTRAYTHVSDVARANLRALLYLVFVDGSGYGVYNIGTDVETSINKIVTLLGGEYEKIKNPRGVFEEMRKCANLKKAKEVLLWEPKVTIEEGIKMLKEDK